jgi:uncharacterized OsmC-like protein
MSDLVFSVKGSSENATKFVANARNFQLIIDEPPALGGGDEGANPVEYLLASYAGCLNVMGFLIAGELGFKLEKLEIELTGNINPERFLGKSNAERAGFKGIEVKLKPYAEVEKPLLDKWIAIIESRCPVNDNLLNATPIAVTVLQPEFVTV